VIYQYLVQLFGTDILWAISLFLSPLIYHNDTLSISTSMKQPITPEIERLVQNGLKFRTEQNLNIIINNQNSYNRSIDKTLIWDNGWFANGISVGKKDLQNVMGITTYSFSNFSFSENDDILIFIQSTILPDEEFTASTDLKTQVLWNFYSPSIRSEYVFRNGTFVKQ
jgi:hypothetical protein